MSEIRQYAIQALRDESEALLNLPSGHVGIGHRCIVGNQ